MTTRSVVIVCFVVLLAACASNPEKMTDNREPSKRDRADCMLANESMEAGVKVEQPPSWCRDDQSMIQWSSDDKDKDAMKVDFKRKHGDDD